MPVLPGIFGTGRNWATVARRVVRARPEWGALLIDLRQHGASLGFPPPHTLASAAADLARTLEKWVHGPGPGTPAAPALLGHSFGGKVALRYARDHGDALESLWVVDSDPGARAPGGSAWAMLEALRRVPGPFPDRAAGVAALEGLGVATPTAQWMALNLAPGEGGVRWRIDPEDMEALLLDFFRTDLWEVVEAPRPGLTVHVVKAEESSLLDESACRRVEEAGRRTGRVRLHRVAGGHWVNADNPDALVAALVDGLP